MDSYLTPYVPVLILLLLAGVMCTLISFLAGFLGPKRISGIKETAFECGSPTTGDPHALATVLMGAALHTMERDVRAIVAGQDPPDALGAALIETWHRTIYQID